MLSAVVKHQKLWVMNRKREEESWLAAGKGESGQSCQEVGVWAGVALLVVEEWKGLVVSLAVS